MLYAVVLHKDKESDFGVTVPGLPGCYSAGDTVEEAINMAKEAIECHIEGLLLDGEPIPQANPIEQHHDNQEYADAYSWAVVEVDLSKLSGKTQRINITMPDLILRQVDSYAERKHLSRSALITDAVLKVIRENAA